MPGPGHYTSASTVGVASRSGIGKRLRNLPALPPTHGERVDADQVGQFFLGEEALLTSVPQLAHVRSLIGVRSGRFSA